MGGFNPVEWGGDVIETDWGTRTVLDACTRSGRVLASVVLINENSTFVVPANTRVEICDEEYTGGERWVGVVVPYEEEQNCRTGSAMVPERTPYDGPCRSGWIKVVFILDDPVG